MSSSFGAIDTAVLIGYFAVIIATSVFAMCRFQRNTTTGYFLAGRFITFLPIGASLFVSNIGSEHFIGLAGSGAASGIGVGAFELNALFLCQLLGWLFLPVYLASGVITLPEYLQKRFGGRRVNVFLSVVSLLLYVLSKISVNLFSGALFIEMALQWDIYASIFLIIGITAIFTLSGGLAAVIYTDAIQAVLMVAGGFVLMIFAFLEVGGLTGLYEKYMLAIPNITKFQALTINGTASCGYPRTDSLQMLRHPWNSDIPWPGFLLGSTAACIWYWCADQVIVQRALAAKNLAHGQGGCLVAGYLKILPLFMIVMPGMISRVLYPDEIGCVLPEECLRICGNAKGCSNAAYPKLVMNLMPTGLKGLMVAVMLAALITDLTSIYNSASTLFTIDIYPLIRKRASNRELMIIGRAFVVVMTVLSILWVPIIKSLQGGQLFMYIQAVQAFMGPPISAVFIIAVIWPRANEQGAFWSLIAGIVTGGIRMGLEFAFQEPACGEPDERPDAIRRLLIHYMYFALLLFVQTIIVMVAVSLATQPLPYWRIIRTVYKRRFDSRVRPDEWSDQREEAPLTGASEIDPVAKSEPENVKHSKFHRAMTWWCGLNETDGERPKAVTEDAAKESVEKLTELLVQKKKTKVILYANLVLILVVTVVLYVLFSLPPSWLGFAPQHYANSL